jgi:hypothetical protein
MFQEELDAYTHRDRCWIMTELLVGEFYPLRDTISKVQFTTHSWNDIISKQESETEKMYILKTQEGEAWKMLSCLK